MNEAAQPGPGGSSPTCGTAASRSLFLDRWVRVTVLLGLVLRVWLCFAYRSTELVGDELEYASYARNLVVSATFSPDAGEDPRPSMGRMPGYPLFVAVGHLLVPGRTGVAILQVVLDVSATLISAWLARTLGASLQVARAVVLVGAACPFTAHAAQMLLSEIVAGFLVTLVVALIVGTLRDGWWPRALLSGALTGAAVLVRLDLMLVGLAGGVSFVRRPRLLGLYALGIGVGLAPWAARNWFVFGVPSPLCAPYATRAPVQPIAFMSWVRTWAWRTQDLQEVVWPYLGSAWADVRLPSHATRSEAELRDVRRILDALREDPTRSTLERAEAEFGRLAQERRQEAPLHTWVVLPVLRLGRMWISSRSGGLVEGRSLAVGLLGLDVLLLAAALGGLPALIRRCQPGTAIVVGFTPLRSLAFAYLALFEPRYTLPCFYLLFIPAAGSCCWALERVRGVSSRARLGPA